MKSLEELSQADKINRPLYPHEIFIAGQIALTAGEEKNDFIQTQGEFTNQKILFFGKIINFTVVDEFPVHHLFYKLVQRFFGYPLIFDDVAVNPEKIERSYRRIESFFRKLVKELFHDISPCFADIEIFPKSCCAKLSKV